MLEPSLRGRVAAHLGGFERRLHEPPDLTAAAAALVPVAAAEPNRESQQRQVHRLVKGVCHVAALRGIKH